MKIKHRSGVYKIGRSTRKGKQKYAQKIKPTTGKKVNFGDKSMKEYPGTKRGDNYCARSSGIKNKTNPSKANFWSRKLLWRCAGKKSQQTLKGTGLKKV